MINLLRARSWPQGILEGAAAGAGSLDAEFQRILDAEFRRTYRHIYRMVRSEPDAADLTQETFVRVYRALPRLRESGAAAAWIRRIATNLCLDFLRRRKAMPVMASLDAGHDSEQFAPVELVDPSADPEQLFATAESVRTLYRAISLLPEDYRTVILLHHVEDMRVEDIARHLHVPAGTIKSRLSRARRALRRKLAPYFAPESLAKPTASG